MSDSPNQSIRRFRLNEVVRQFIDFRGRTPLKLGMEWGGGEVRALSANNVQMGRIDFAKEAYFASDALYRRWMTKGDCERGRRCPNNRGPLRETSRKFLTMKNTS